MDGPHPELNPRVRGLRPSATVAINEHSDALRAQGRDIVKFGLGQSPFPVPASVVEALRQTAHEKDYLSVQGFPPLRDTVAQFHARRDGLMGCSGEDVLIGPGSKELLFLLQLAYAGDLVIPNPAWVSYAPQARIIGRPVRTLETSREDGWRLSPEILDAHCRDDPDQPRILILNYPSNPTGMTLDAERLQALAAVARQHRVVVVSDEIYGGLHHEGKHTSIAHFYPEGTIVSGGISKWCGAGGWRLGTFLFPPHLRWLLEAMAAVASETYTSVSAPIQHAAVSAFLPNPAIDDYLNRARRVLRTLGPWCASQLRDAGAHSPDPEGAFYLFPDFGDHREQLARRNIHDAATLCTQLLEDTGVATLPGTVFGRPADELTIRIAYVDFDGAAALDASGDGVAMNAEWISRYCPRVDTGIRRIHDWING
jgi:aspartate aminotransferase